MSTLIWFLVWFGSLSALTLYQPKREITFTALGGLMLATLLFSPISLLILVPVLFMIGAAAALTFSPSKRKKFVTRPLLQKLLPAMPRISDTEQTALEAGTVWWEGQLFSGEPNWQDWFSRPRTQLTDEEKAFIAGPVEQVCQMTDDWQVTQYDYDLSKEVWAYLKEAGFFGLVIPKEYGGLGFSPYGHSEIVTKLASRSVVLSTTVTVPNTLGPSELLLHYGTTEQKDYYLPRLATGEEIPCFALTNPDAGSDAGRIPDQGVICYGTFEGKRVIGIKLNWDKRYITLAPVATVLGLAFQLSDPENLLGEKTDIGITCALIPVTTKGITIGRRHLPMTICFQNGPTQGKDVFIPLDYVIGGADRLGQGWKMLMECLSSGRAISLPASSSGGSTLGLRITGAYSTIREQFNQSIIGFEGIKEAFSRIILNAYRSNSLRNQTAYSVNCGEQPSVASAISKCHVTNMSREICMDAMDIHAGKSVISGPNNILGSGYNSVPISITVEGANILTRSMIIFGQGAIRCHPTLYKMFQAIQDERVDDFDHVLWAQSGWALKMGFKSFLYGLTSAHISQVQHEHPMIKRLCQQMNQASSAFALSAHLSLVVLGGKLKFKESLSARLGDMLSELLIVSCCMKEFADADMPADEEMLVKAACDMSLANFWHSMTQYWQNFEPWPLAKVCKRIVMPFGNRSRMPSDTICHQLADQFSMPCNARERLCKNNFIGQTGTDYVANLEHTLQLKIALKPVEEKMRRAMKAKQVEAYSKHTMYEQALEQGLITPKEFEQWVDYKAWHDKIIAVDDFTTEELQGKKKRRSRTTKTKTKEEQA